MMKKTIILLVFLLACSMLAGCANKSGSTNRNVEKPPIVTYAKANNIEADIYLDGTFSMAGYVNYPSTTVYVDALKGIERTITSNWKQEKVQYIKFGDSLQQLNRDQFLKYTGVTFYQEKDTSLQKVVESMDGNKLNVLVSDLFQTNQDIDSLLIALKRICFADSEKAMALIGVKSQFNGKIYDIGKNLVSFTYSSSDDVNSYRPFYLLILGKEADVRAFAVNYANNFKDDKLVRMALFSKHIGTKAGLAAGKAITKANSKEKIANMAQISTLLGSNSDIPQYRLKLDEKISGFNSILTAGDIIGNCPNKFERFEYKVEKWEQANTGKQKMGLLDKIMGKAEKASGTAQFNEIKARDFLDVSSEEIGMQGNDVNVNLLFKFNPAGIRKAEGKYRLNIALYPSKENYIEGSATFEDWSFSDDAALNAEALQAVGGKTLNINSFVKTVSALNYEMNKPGFYDIYVYLEALK